MCSSGQVTLELIADELEGKWEPIEDRDPKLEGDSDGEDDEDLAEFMSDDEEDNDGEGSGYAVTRSNTEFVPIRRRTGYRDYREATPFVDQNDLLQDVANELRLAGRDFLVVDGQHIEIQHNSVRDFVLSEEEAIKPDEVQCPECRKRLKETYAYEAGPKEGNRKYANS